MNEKEELRKTFDCDANQYDEARPGYPSALFEDIIEFSKIPKNGKILEIGSGTGQATLPLARQGYSIHCVELGENLVAVAKKNLSPYPNVQVSTGSFEEIPLETNGYELVISATAFHWIDPDIGYPKIAKILKQDGAIALFWNKPVQTKRSEEFFESVQSVYECIVPTMAKKFPGLPHPDTISLPVKDEIDRSGNFGNVTVRKYYWGQEYTSKTYVNLLSTYSDHLSLDLEIRTQLLEGIEEHIETKYGGRVLKEYLSILYLAHRKD